MLDSNASAVPSESPEDFGLTPEELATLGQESPDDDEDEASAAAPSSPEAPAAPGSATSPGTSPAAHSPTPASPAPGESAAAPASSTPFLFKTDGRDVALTGVETLPDQRIAFTPAAWADFRSKWVADRSAWVAKERRYKGQIQQARHEASEQRTAGEARAEAVMDRFTALAETFQSDPEAALNEAAKLFTALPMLTAKAEAEYWRKRHDGQAQRVAPMDREAAWREAEPEFWPALEAVLDEYLARPEYAAAAGARADLLAELKRAGVEEGGLFQDAEGAFRYNDALFLRILQTEVRLAQRVAAAKTQAQGAAAVTARNAAVLTPTQKAPPAVPVRATVPSGTPAAGRPTNKREWQAHLARLAEEE